MFKIRFFVLFFLGCCLSTSGAEEKMDLKNTAEASMLTDLNAPIVVKAPEKKLVIRLKSNATTGYHWVLKSYDSNLLTLQQHEYRAPDTKLIGAPGCEVWTFAVAPEAFRTPALHTVVFSYQRPWEKENTNVTNVLWSTH